MYVAKSRGRNNFQFFSGEMNTQAQARAEFETRLRQALHKQELALNYQPQIDLASGRIVAVEALLRWHTPTGESIAPGEIISVAEESGLIFPLGEWTLEEACRQGPTMAAGGPAAAAHEQSTSPGTTSGRPTSPNACCRSFPIPAWTRPAGNRIERACGHGTHSGEHHDPDRPAGSPGIHLAIDDFGKGSSRSCI